ncbi:MAG: response regulator [Microcystaceae cyanobacterium]
MNTARCSSVDSSNFLSQEPMVPLALLRHLAETQVTGTLTVQNPLDEFVHWQVYWGNGRIHFASSAKGKVERLQYLMGQQLRQLNLNLPPDLENDYDFLWQLWKDNFFSAQQTHSIFNQVTQEALVQILSLSKSLWYFDSSDRLEKLFINLELEHILTPLQHKIRYWSKLRPEITSPFQRPLVEDWSKLQPLLQETTLAEARIFPIFAQGLRNFNCLYELASRIEYSTLQLGILLSPLLKQGAIKMLPYQEVKQDHRPLAIAVEQRSDLQSMMKVVLEDMGFRVLIIDKPLQALAVIVAQNPKVVLLQTDLPEMNGFQLCSLCRKSSLSPSVPIILISSEEVLTEKIRAKLSGASRYIGQPFLPQELISVVEKSLNSAIA